MLNVTIQNDGKIKFQSECSNTKELKFNVNLLLGVIILLLQPTLLMCWDRDPAPRIILQPSMNRYEFNTCLAGSWNI